MWPWTAILGESITSVAIAATAVDELVELVKTKTPSYQAVALRDQELAQHGAARAKARVDAARDTLHRAAEQAYDQVESDGGLLDTESKVRLQLACSFAAEVCVDAARQISDVAGTSSIRLGQPFERHQRDLHTAAQHASKSSPRYMSAGRLMFGLENDWIWLTF
jgi:alkylation response protein AidB-like acyl-CoA dehydrogenase